MGKYRIFYDVEEKSASGPREGDRMEGTQPFVPTRKGASGLKIVELTTIAPALAELLDLAGEEPLMPQNVRRA